MAGNGEERSGFKKANDGIAFGVKSVLKGVEKLKSDLGGIFG